MKKYVCLSFLLMMAQIAYCQIITAIPNSTGTYANPIIASDCPDPCYTLGDDGYYYVYGTARLINIFRSKNLTSWTKVGTAFTSDTYPRFVPKTNSTWAPNVVKINGKYVMYYALSVWGGIDSCGIGVAVSNKPEGPFVNYNNPETPENEGGKLFLSYEIGVTNSIDPCYVEENGKKYLFWGSFKGIYAIELADDGLSLKPGAEKVKIAGSAFEGTDIFKKDNYYYFLGSTGSCCEGANSTYKTVIGRSTSLLGPYVNSSGGRLLDNKYDILIQGNDAWAGTGHNASLLTDKVGDTWIIYHAYSKKNPEMGRLALMDKVQWKNGWPFVQGKSPSARAASPVVN